MYTDWDLNLVGNYVTIYTIDNSCQYIVYNIIIYDLLYRSDNADI